MPEISETSIYVVKVIIGITANALNKLFTYQLPTDLIDLVDVGSVVLVPFGKGDIIKHGYVIEKGVLESQPEYQLKQILRVEDQVAVEKKLIQLAYWMHNRYQCTLTAALRLMLPAKIDVKLLSRKVVTMNEEQIQKTCDYIISHQRIKRLEKRCQILQFMVDSEPTLEEDGVERSFIEKDLLTRFATSSATIKGIVELGLISQYDENVHRNIHVLRQRPYVEKLRLNNEQENALTSILSSKNEHKTFLLHGVTGSGKTEVYMQLIEQVILDGKQAIVLIPEIGLTPQTIMRFKERFGEIVGVMHSRLNLGERYEQWQHAKSGKTKIMIGARSAVFTPFLSIGIIIVDEEHEHTYKSEQNPRYHAREVAIKRGMEDSFPVVLGSATPLIESYHKALLQQYTLIELKTRAVSNASKSIEIIDMRLELEASNLSVLSRVLKTAIEDALSRKEQVILFLNRRGYANSLSCRKCGFVYTCDNCDVSMNYHKSIHRLMCHLCGDSKKVQSTCPKCDSKYIKAFGAGTQRIESYLQTVFTEANIGRMDQDSTSGKHGHEKLLDQFREKKIDILIGTQMIAKGHDFHNVTVVGVLAADLSLNTEDFRAAERTFQLVTQVIGRTGRGDLSGKAFIQTYQPNHYAIVHAVTENYKAFYEEENLFRKTLIYPPYCQLLEIVCMSENEYLGKEFLTEYLGLIHSILSMKKDPIDAVLGPTKTSIGKINGLYRYRVIIKGSSYKKLTLVMKELYNVKDNASKYKNLKLVMDLNPMSLS